MPDRSWDFSGSFGEKDTSEAKMYGIPALGWTAPTSDGSNMYFGGGMYGTSGLGVDYATTLLAPQDAVPQSMGGPMDTNYKIDGYSQIQFWQMAPTLAWRQSDALSLGVSLNIDYQSVGFQERLTADTAGEVMNFNMNRQAGAFGYGLSFGALYKVNDMITVGASYKSKQDFSKLEYQLRAGDIQAFPDGAGGLVTSKDGTYKMDLDYPQQLAGGITVKPNDALKVSFDVKWINWSDTMDKLAVTGDFTGGNKAALDPGWDDQTVYALGVDYAVNDRWNVRAGYNYSESPVQEEDVFSNLILPAVVESHATLGATYKVNNHWDVAFAYMRAFSNDVKGKNDIPAPYNQFFGDSSNAKISLEENSYSFDIGYRF